jgi:biotin--protein ligase
MNQGRIVTNRCEHYIFTRCLAVAAITEPSFLCAMNVVVYAGPEVAQPSLSRIITTLKTLLSPNYTVQSLTSQAISSQPWSPTCALLVLPECTRFMFTPSRAMDEIRAYVERGGSALALCAGITRSSQPAYGSLYFRGHWQGYLSLAAKNVTPGSLWTVLNEGAVGPVLIRNDGVIGDVEPADEVLGTQEGTGHVLGAMINAHLGKVAVWVLNLEHPISDDISPLGAKLSADHAEHANSTRIWLLRRTLASLGIQVPTPSVSSPSQARPTPQFLISRTAPTAISQISKALSLQIGGSGGPEILKDTNDVFHYRAYSPLALKDAQNQAIYPQHDPSTWQPKHVLVCTNNTLPPNSETPLFDLEAYFDAIDSASKSDQISQPWRVGDVLYYGEVVTSTQTMLDK